MGENCTKYVQFGNTFNLFHAAASFVLVHQNHRCRQRPDKRSWAQYPAFWTLKHVDSLPTPDPSNIEAFDAKPVPTKGIMIDQATGTQETGSGMGEHRSES